jgi:hypothetical protein
MDSSQRLVYEVARTVAAFWKLRTKPDPADGLVQVLVENANGRWHIDVPRAVTEAACVAVEARSRAWEAVLYAATGIPEESLNSAAGAYALLQRSSVAAGLLTLSASSISTEIVHKLQLHMLGEMTEELFYSEHLSKITRHDGDDQLAAHLRGRYADALARTIAALELEKVIVAQGESTEIDLKFISECRSLFQENDLSALL